jgi:Zn-finger nucleic acid-binding protein
MVPARSRSVIQCPRCEVDAEIVSLGPVDVDSCARCGNIWFDNAELERTSVALDGTPGADLREAVRALLPSRALPAGPAVVACPLCSAALMRRVHSTVAGVVAHVCSLHGAWLEREHLVRLVAEIEAQGLAALEARERRRAAQRAQHARSVERQLEPLRVMARHRFWFWFF